MLTHDFNTLDLMYIQACSDLHAHGNKGVFEIRIKNLALKGYAPAIAKWFQMKGLTECPELDAKMKDFQPEDFEQWAALGIYNKITDFDKYITWLNKYQYTEEQRPTRLGFFDYGERYEYLQLVEENLEQQRGAFKKNTYFNCIDKACSLAIAKTQDMPRGKQHFAAEARVCELMALYIDSLAPVEGFKKERAKLTKKLISKLNILVHAGIRQYFQDKKNNFSPMQNPQYYFAFANLIMLYQKVAKKTDQRLTNLASEIYTNLANAYEKFSQAHSNSKM